jgi:hypothetical protein
MCKIQIEVSPAEGRDAGLTALGQKPGCFAEPEE